MEKKRQIVESDKEPKNKFVLWLRNKCFYQYLNGAWVQLTENVETQIQNLQNLISSIQTTISKILMIVDIDKQLIHLGGKEGPYWRYNNSDNTQYIELKGSGGNTLLQINGETCNIKSSKLSLGGGNINNVGKINSTSIITDTLRITDSVKIEQKLGVSDIHGLDGTHHVRIWNSQDSDESLLIGNKEIVSVDRDSQPLTLSLKGDELKLVSNKLKVYDSNGDICIDAASPNGLKLRYSGDSSLLLDEEGVRIVSPDIIWICKDGGDFEYNVGNIIRNLESFYISKESFTNFIDTLGQSLNKEIVMTWDYPTRQYKFQITDIV